ncbi:uncharacterized protein [Dermacentor andersoni]|uniref:uncharacterized protein isoform X2 n=1 Tax=Dermacentor andersoni TaxID=34620 RepID=UPI003B3BC8DE
MAEERSNEYTPPVFSFTYETSISSSSENSQGTSSSLGAYQTIPETTGVDKWNTQYHPAGAASTFSGNTHSTETGSTNSTLLVYSSSGGVYNAVASTSYVRMEEPSGIFGNDAWFRHRRLLMAIAEGGLAVPHRVRSLPLNTDAAEGTEQFSFYFQVYFFGCMVSVVILAGEIFSQSHRGKRLCRKLNRVMLRSN